MKYSALRKLGISTLGKICYLYPMKYCRFSFVLALLVVSGTLFISATKQTEAPETIGKRFAAPEAFVIDTPAAGSFGAYLRNLPLKAQGTHALTYTGEIASTDAYTASVVDMSIGTNNLQQCADAVMRLKGEYLYAQKKYKEISFHFVNGFVCDYEHYAEGNRYINGKWVQKGKKDYSYTTFLRYMELVFSWANTASLDKDLIKVTDANDVRAGDLFIIGGSPGHCYLVVQTAHHNETGKKKFMLAQSFMPAQNIQVVMNEDTPWFELGKPVKLSGLINPDFLKRFPPF